MYKTMNYLKSYIKVQVFNQNQINVLKLKYDRTQQGHTTCLSHFISQKCFRKPKSNTQICILAQNSNTKIGYNNSDMGKLTVNGHFNNLHTISTSLYMIVFLHNTKNFMVM